MADIDFTQRCRQPLRYGDRSLVDAKLTIKRGIGKQRSPKAERAVDCCDNQRAVDIDRVVQADGKIGGETAADANRTARRDRAAACEPAVQPRNDGLLAVERDGRAKAFEGEVAAHVDQLRAIRGHRSVDDGAAVVPLTSRFTLATPSATRPCWASCAPRTAKGRLRLKRIDMARLPVIARVPPPFLAKVHRRRRDWCRPSGGCLPACR